MKKVITFFFLILIFGSCEDSIKFEEPQPPNRGDLNKFPKKLRGTYRSTSEDTYLTVNERTIIDWVDVEFKMSMDSLDIDIDSSKIVGQSPDNIQIVDGKYNVSLSLVDDSVMVHYSYQDTLFEISNDQVLRSFKGHYFLNYKKSENNWMVRGLTLDKTGLSFSKLGSPKDIEELKEITELKEIKTEDGKVVGYKLKPTRKELKQLMEHSFSDTKTYRKVD